MDRAGSFAKVRRRLDDYDVVAFDRAGYGSRVDEVARGSGPGRGREPKGQHLLGTEALLGLLPDAELHVVEGASHGAHTTHPDGFARFVEAAVRRRRTP